MKILFCYNSHSFLCITVYIVYRDYPLKAISQIYQLKFDHLSGSGWYNDQAQLATCGTAGKKERKVCFIQRCLQSIMIFISSTIGHQAYCHWGIFFYGKPAITSDKQQRIFYVHFPTDRTAPTTIFDGPVVDHWLEWKTAQPANAPACSLDRMIPTVISECSTA